MSDDPRSTMIQDGNIRRIENALVEEDVYKRQALSSSVFSDGLAFSAIRDKNR